MYANQYSAMINLKGQYLNQLLRKDKPSLTEVEELQKLFEPDDLHSEAFMPALKLKSDYVLNNSEADRDFLGILNSRSRRIRQSRFWEKVKDGFEGKRIISEGDSWFQYPILLHDIIDHLSAHENYALYCLGFAGDWLSNILEEREYMHALQKIDADVFLISGGGNDLVGGNRIATLLRPYSSRNPDRLPKNYLNAEFNTLLDNLAFLFDKLFTNLTTKHPDMHIICHGYDYCIPNKGNWFGGPMEYIGIPAHAQLDGQSLQRLIVKEVIDAFNERLGNVATEFYQVSYIDCRGIIAEDEWYDELHPKSTGFAKIAARFEQLIEK